MAILYISSRVLIVDLLMKGIIFKLDGTTEEWEIDKKLEYRRLAIALDLSNRLKSNKDKGIIKVTLSHNGKTFVYENDQLTQLMTGIVIDHEYPVELEDVINKLMS